MLTDRRSALALLAGAIVTPALTPTSASAQAPAMSRITAYAFTVTAISPRSFRPTSSRRTRA
jgi:hypothetical protein